MFARAYRTEGILSHGDISFREEKVLWAEPNFVELFSYNILYKTTEDLLSEPNTMLISDKTALKYFGKLNPTGEILKLDGKQAFKIIGIFESQPKSTHFDADILLSYINWHNQLGDNVNLYGWVYSGFYTYVRVKPNTDIKDLNEKIEDYINQELGDFMKTYKLKMGYKRRQ